MTQSRKRFHLWPILTLLSASLVAGGAGSVRSEDSAIAPGPAGMEKFVPTPDQLRGDQRFGSRPAGRVYKSQISPHWFDGDSRFWYRNDLRGGKREFLLVDAAEGNRRPAFDHERLAAALHDAGVADAASDRLPIEALEFSLDENVLGFQAGGMRWSCNLGTYELKEMPKKEPAAEDGPSPRPLDAPRASSRSGEETELTFVNRTGGEVELFWLDAEGQRRSYGKLAAGEKRVQHTFAGHIWEVVDAAGRTLAVLEADAAGERTEITATSSSPPLRARGGGSARRGPRDASPDGKWTAFTRDNNLYLRSNEDDKETRLSDDGQDGFAYGRIQWSPDSQSLFACRIEPGEEKEVYLLESSPRGGGRAVLHSRQYALPGDKFASYELNLFHIAEQKHLKPEVERIDFGEPRIRWSDDCRTFTYEKVDRGHQRFRLIEVDAQTGQARNLIDEKTETFLWTAHRDRQDFRDVTWLEKSDEIIYVSERDGWRHLYLIDVEDGAIKNQITEGDWVVRGVDRIDEENRQIWFRASGMHADQDPYLIHCYRINFDGSGLTALTEGNGNHTVQVSPERQYLIDTYSRVDLPPVHELRRVSDGKFLCELERSDISELEENGYQPPEVFSAKGRDGKTDIWGIICRPRDLDPSKKYPVIEQIYAGPQGSYVPKSFSAASRFESLTSLGFIVVQIDGMGTANRSKAFHDVCWKNLKDAGLPDRILWHQAVAARYPYYDISRVGIYGGSAGGQNSTAAVLFHPEFYKAAVSGCGCHDNRLDKASWNEQWMGYPVGPQYAESSNIENAGRLQGKLLLIVGEMDMNVPVESTYRLADALIKANKDFELVVVPGAGHGMGGPYGDRKMKDFFVRSLHGVEPPDRNAQQSAFTGGQ